LHTGRGLKLQQAEERHDHHAANLKRQQDEHADDLKQLAEATTTEAGVKTLLEQVRFEVGKDPDAIKIAEHEGTKTGLQEKVTALRTAQQSVRKQLDDRHYRWTNWRKHGEALPLEGLKQALVVDDRLLANLRSGKDLERLTAMQSLAGFPSIICCTLCGMISPQQKNGCGSWLKTWKIYPKARHLDCFHCSPPCANSSAIVWSNWGV